MNDFTYEGLRRVTYGDMWFVPVCPKCGRFVRADETLITIGADSGGAPTFKPNATCSQHGRVTMPFEGYFEPQESSHE